MINKEEYYQMINLVFQSKPARLLAWVGRFFGVGMSGICLLICILDHGFLLFNDKLTTPCLIVGFAGFVIDYLLHKLAIRIDKKKK